MTHFHLSATACAVLTMLTLSACGGTKSAFDGPISSTTIWSKPATTTTTTTPTTTTEDTAEKPPKPNQDSDQFTSASPRPADSVIDSLVLPQKLHTNVLRDNLHQRLKDAYGKEFNTTFSYHTNFTNNKTQAKSQTFNNAWGVGTLTNVFDKGFQTYTMDETLETNIDGVKYTGERKGTIKIYQNDNSLVLGYQTLSGQMSDSSNPQNKKAIEKTDLRIDHLKGSPFKRPSEDAVKAAQEDLKSKSEEKSKAEETLKEQQSKLEELKKQQTQANQTSGTNNSGTNSGSTNDIKEQIKEAEDQTKKAQADFNNAKAEFDKADALVKKHAKIEEIFKGEDKKGIAGGMQFSYKGQAFNQDSSGDLEYHINFNTLAGHGVITKLSGGTINLNEADIQSIDHKNPDETVKFSEGTSNQTQLLGIKGVAHFADNRPKGTYTLGIFGDYAEEVAGFVTEDNINTVGFGGKKQQNP